MTNKRNNMICQNNLTSIRNSTCNNKLGKSANLIYNPMENKNGDFYEMQN